MILLHIFIHGKQNFRFLKYFLFVVILISFCAKRNNTNFHYPRHFQDFQENTRRKLDIFFQTSRFSISIYIYISLL